MKKIPTFALMNTPADIKASVDSHIASLDLAHLPPANLYEPIAYLLSMKGKRIRPVLTLLAYQAVTGRAEQEAMNLAVSLELFHNFTLMHDDIMDRAPVRRGLATVHTKWDENIAILSGDALFAYSMGLAAKDFPQQAARLVAEYSRVAMEVCEGQMEDMDMATQHTVSIQDYLEMIRKKTAVLLGGCLSMGAIAGEADDQVVELMRQFGEKLGVAFQLQDDLMDAFPPEGFGKQVGGDIIENKKTYLLLKAQELASPAQHQRLELLMNETLDNQSKVEGVLQVFGELNIQAETEQLIGAYIQEAITLGDQLSQWIPIDQIRAYVEVIAKRKL